MLRVCEARDLEFILRIRNSPDVIEVSNRQRPLAITELPHPDDPAYRMWIICEDGIDYGYVIAELEGRSYAVISIALEPHARGRGLGTGAIREACLILFNEYKVRRVIAEIYAGNSASLKAFEKAGFRKSKTVRMQDMRIKYIYNLRAPK